MSLEAVLQRIAGGDAVPSSELLPYLCVETREHRATVNKLLAKAYSETGREEDLKTARVFIHRAWLLSDFSPELLPLYTSINAALHDVEAIREAYKRLGIKMGMQGDASRAIEYFNLWQFAYHTFSRLDKYEYDFDVLGCIDALARPHRLAVTPPAGIAVGEKLRVAYLVKGMTELGSVMVLINLLFARYHDHARVKPMFFVPESESEVLASEAGRQHLSQFKELGYEVFMAPDFGSKEEKLLAVGRMIHDARAHLLVTDAVLAGFEHYFVASLRPAPFVVGFVQGPPPQFAPPGLDWGIAWSKHPLIDCLIDCSHVEMEFDLTPPSEVIPHQRSEFNIPDDAIVAASSGRYVKFQDRGFWEAIIDLLGKHPHLYYLTVGVEEHQVPFLSSMLSDELRSRLRFFTWRGKEYLRLMRLVDLVIDTYPSGGGGTLCDPMALGIPVVSFKNNYLKQYDQTDWSPAEEFINLPERIVDRGDFVQLKQVVSRIVDDPDYRRRLAEGDKEFIWETRSHPERTVRNCEEIYFRLVGESSTEAPTDSVAVEIEKLNRPRRRAPFWLAAPARQLRRGLRFGIRVLDRFA
jgi:glycosyltransferase involved in cell wall biosynthesis